MVDPHRTQTNTVFSEKFCQKYNSQSSALISQHFLKKSVDLPLQQAFLHSHSTVNTHRGGRKKRLADESRA